MSGLERPVDRTGQIIAHGVEVSGLAQPGMEGSHHRFGVITGPVEPAINAALHPAAQWIEQRRGDQRGGGDRHRLL
jgi:hypothetical protein